MYISLYWNNTFISPQIIDVSHSKSEKCPQKLIKTDKESKEVHYKKTKKKTSTPVCHKHFSSKQLMMFILQLFLPYHLIDFPYNYCSFMMNN